MEIISTTNEDYELWILLTKARHAMFRAREKELSKYKISPTHALILKNIYSLGDGATTKKISQRLFREFHTVFVQLNIMANEGLVQKIKDFPRKDRSRFVLTDKGLEAYNQTAIKESIEKIMSVLSQEERQHLKAYLEKLLEAAVKELNLPHFQYRSKPAE